MAERRMFAKTIIDSDAFLDMPHSTQLLYFHLSMRADDDGFINNPKKVQRMVGCGDDDLRILIAKNFIIPFESGVVVIKHWRIHNFIRTDRYKETVYQEEKAMLETKDNKAYTLCQPLGIPNDNQMETQVRLGKDRLELGKDSIEDKSDKPTKPPRHKYGRYNNVLLTDEEMEKLQAEYPTDYQERVERLSEYIESKGAKYKNYLATIRAWDRRDKEKNDKPSEQQSSNPFLRALQGGDFVE